MKSIIKVKFTFDDELMKKSGYERENVYYTIKKHLQADCKSKPPDSDLLCRHLSGGFSSVTVHFWGRLIVHL